VYTHFIRRISAFRLNKDLIPQPLLLKEKWSAGALAAAVDSFRRRDKNLISNQLTLVEKFNISQQPYYLIIFRQ
jgi:hypothetical protein